MEKLQIGDLALTYTDFEVIIEDIITLSEVREKYMEEFGIDSDEIKDFDSDDEFYLVRATQDANNIPAQAGDRNVFPVINKSPNDYWELSPNNFSWQK